MELTWYLIVANNPTFEGSFYSGAVFGVTLFPPFEVMSNLQSLVGLSLHHWYSVSPSYSISAPCLLKCMLHPALTSSPPAIRLWGISGTLNAFLAVYGNLLSSNNWVSVVIIVVLLGVPRV